MTIKQPRRKQSLLNRFFKRAFWVFVILFFGTLLWQSRHFLSLKFLFETHVVLFTNEAEARPCGGFVTAYGEVRAMPPRFFLKNIYDLNYLSFGTTNPPLSSVSPDLKFWDLGTSPDLGICTETFQKAYLRTEREVDRIWLVDLSTVEDLLVILGPLEVDLPDEAGVLTADNFFPRVSRLVAKVDRHDEETLETRKSPLSTIGKKLMREIILSPTKWHQVSKLIAQKVKNGRIYIQYFSPEFRPSEDSLAIIEWNLGGGKTSRALKKFLTLDLREVEPQQWQGEVVITARNLGGWDEPLGQNWKGGFGVDFPQNWGKRSEFIAAEIAPGESFSTSIAVNFTGKLEKLPIFVPRGQDFLGDISVALFPQQAMQSSTLKTYNNAGSFFGKLASGKNIFSWEVVTDTMPPFLTFHEKINLHSVPDELQKDFAASGFLVELHFNEEVVLQENFTAFLKDRDYTNSDILENLHLKQYLVVSGNTTLLLDFKQEAPQPEERFYIEMDGLTDRWGNQFELTQNTIIDR